MDRTETIGEHLGQENVFVTTEIIGAATKQAIEVAERWLEEEENGSQDPRA